MYLLGEAESGAERVERKVGEQRRRGEAEEIKEREERARAEAIVARAKAMEAERRRARQEAADRAAAEATEASSAPLSPSGAAPGTTTAPASSAPTSAPASPSMMMSFPMPPSALPPRSVTRRDPLEVLGSHTMLTRVLAPHLSLADIRRCGLVCSRWHAALFGDSSNDGNDDDHDDDATADDDAVAASSSSAASSSAVLWGAFARRALRGYPAAEGEDIISRVRSAASMRDIIGGAASTHRAHPARWARTQLALPEAAATDSVDVVAVSCQGTVVAGCAGGQVIAWWDGASGASALVATHDERVTAVACATDGPGGGAYAASGSEYGVVMIVSRRSNACTVLTGHIADITAVVPCHGGARLATAGSDYLLNVYIVATGALAWSVQESVSVTAPPFPGLWCPVNRAGEESDGTLETVVYGDDECPAIKVYRTATGEVLSTESVPSPASEDLDAVALSGVHGDKVQLGHGRVVAAADDDCVRISRNMSRFGEVLCAKLECYHLHPVSGLIYAADRDGAVSICDATEIFGEVEAEPTALAAGPAGGHAGIAAIRVNPQSTAAVAAFRDGGEQSVAWFSFVQAGEESES
jgi:hypothetical protein